MPQRDSIFVTGATGTVGRPIVSHLIARGFDVWAATRVPGLVGGRMPAVFIDWDDPATYRPFLSSARTVVLVVPTMHGAVERARTLIRAAVELGVGHIIKVSPIGTGTALSTIDAWHDAIDSELRGSQLPTTQLRMAPVMQTWLTRRPLDGIYEGASSSPLPYVDARDAAELVAALTASPANADFTVTGSVGHPPEAMVAIIADVLGVALTYRRIDDADLWTRFTDAGVAPDVADLLVEHHRATDALTEIAPTTDLADVLGHKPAGFARFVADHEAQFRSMLLRPDTR